MLIVAAAEIESSLLARRLGRWGARTCAVSDDNIAAALLPERAWDALLVDTAVAQRMIASGRAGAIDVPRRIVLITPAERHELPALKDAGFTGYLVKPVRAASLAARFAAEDSFESQAQDRAPESETSGATVNSAKACRSWSPRTMRSTPCLRARCYRGSAIVRQSLPTALAAIALLSSPSARTAAPTIWC